MTKQKLILTILIMFLLCLSSVSAALFLPQSSSLVDYYFPTNTSTTNCIDESNSTVQYNLTSTGTTYHYSGANSRMRFDGDGDYGTTDATFVWSTNMTFAFWIMGAVAQEDNYPVILEKDSNKMFRMSLYADGSHNNLDVYTGNGAAWDTQCLSDADLRDNEWHHVTATINSVDNEINIYIDGVINKSCANAVNMDLGADNFIIGSRYDQAVDYFLEGNLTNVLVYNSIITAGEVATIYGLGRTKYTLGVTPTVNTVTITPSPVWWDTTNITCIANITYSVNATLNFNRYGTNIYNETFTSGNFETLNITINDTYYNATQNITCTAFGENGTGTNATSTSANYFINPPTVDYINLINTSTIFPYDMICNYSVLHPAKTVLFWEVTNSMVLYNTTTFNVSNYTNDYLGEELYCRLNLTIPSQNWASFNISNNFTVGQWINFSASDLDGATIDNFTVTTDAGEWNTTSGWVYVYGYNDTYNVTIDAEGYAINSSDFVFNESISYDWRLYTTNSINFTFRDEDTLALITNNVTIEILNGHYYTGSTTSGTIYFDLITPDSFTVRYSAIGYDERLYFFTMINRSTSRITLYLGNTSNIVNVTATVYDENTDFVEGCIIKVLREDSSNASNFIQIQMAETNFEGVTKLGLTLNNIYYKFILEYPSGTTKKLTDKTFIYDTSLDFQIIIGELVGEDFDNTQEVYVSLTFDNNTNSYNYIFNDGASLISQSCLEIYTYSISFGEVLYSSSCVSSTSGTIVLPVALVNGTTYLGKAFIYYGTNRYLADTLFHYFRGSDNLDSGKLSAFVVIFLLITFAGLALWSPVVSVILFPFGLTLPALIDLVYVRWEVLLGLHIISVILAFVMSRRG